MVSSFASTCKPVDTTLGQKAGRRFGRTTQIAVGVGMGILTHAQSVETGGLEELVLVSEGRGGGPRGDVKFVENIAHVPVDCLFAQGQLLGDGLVGLAGGDQAKHLQLPLRQSAGAAARHVCGERGDTGQVRHRAKLREAIEGREDDTLKLMADLLDVVDDLARKVGKLRDDRDKGKWDE